MKKYFLIIFLFNLHFFAASPIINSVVESVKVIRVNSIKQQVTDFSKVTLEGEVEVWVDQKFHIWADKVFIDKDKQTLLAEKGQTTFVFIESNDFSILADKLFLDLDKKTGYADNIRIHFPDGFIRSAHAKKLADDSWEMEDIVYTPCDAKTPHWSITARKAKLYKNYLVRVEGVLFKFGKVPFFILPMMVMPMQNRSKSGFLVPKVSYDEDLGFGFTQAYYWSIAPRIDNTLTFDWRQKKGIAFNDQFRWVRKPESYSLLSAQYAIERNAYVKKKNKIVKSTDYQYWVQGKDFRGADFGLFGKWDNLIRFDFGTDNKIDYKFFNNQNSLDDIYYNSWIFRKNNQKDLINFLFDSTQTSRKQFTQISPAQKQNIINLLPDKDFLDLKKDIFSEKREVEDKVTVNILPHFEWNSYYRNLKNLFDYRHDIFLDEAFLREEKTEKFYLNSQLIKKNDLQPLQKGNTGRFFYQGDFRKTLNLKDQVFTFYVDPILQARTHVKNNKKVDKAKFFFGAGAEWDMPEAVFSKKDDYFYYLQPFITWNFISKLKQDNWFYMDKWDRIYPENNIKFNLRNNWYVKDMQFDLNLKTGYEFYDKKDLFNLSRQVGQNHFIYPNLDFIFTWDILSIDLLQEYDWKNLKLAESRVNFVFDFKKFNFYVGSLYQDQILRKERALFSDISHFILFGISVPVWKNAKISYDGQFYTDEKDAKFIPFDLFKPLSHFLRLDYQGHCWGVTLGFEEKNYKEYGNWKSDKAFSLYIKLESLGSFARKFKRPSVYKY